MAPNGQGVTEGRAPGRGATLRGLREGGVSCLPWPGHVGHLLCDLRHIRSPPLQRVGYSWNSTSERLDKGKPPVKEGRKATGLGDEMAALPKDVMDAPTRAVFHIPSIHCIILPALIPVEPAV
jgi:hypothetical protein